MLRVAVLASGRGSHFVSLTQAAQRGELPIQVIGVYCDRPQAPVLQRADELGVTANLFAPQDYPNRAAHEAALFRAVDAEAPDLIICAGYMRVIGADTVRPRSARMFNIHPSLLPKYRGLHTHQRALQAGDLEHGASVHFVTPELDGGPVLAQVRVPVMPNDNQDVLSQRVLAREHPLLRACVALYASGRVRLGADAIEVDGAPLKHPLRLDEANRLI